MGSASGPGTADGRLLPSPAVPREIAAAALGLAAAAAWGAGDFSGGLASKRAPLLGVLVLGQATGIAMLAVLALLAGEGLPGPGALAWAVAGGAAGALGLAALYRGLAVGRMAVVAPVSAVLSAAIPVVVGAVGEGLPPAAKLAGFALALLGIWLVAGASGARQGEGGGGLLLALAAGAGFGAFLVFMRHAGEGGTFWPVAAARTTSLALSLATALGLRRPWVPPRAALPAALASGALDSAANAFFVLASQAGRLDVAAVLSSLYPASTLVLAALILRERVSRPQGVGIAAVLVAIVLIAG